MSKQGLPWFRMYTDFLNDPKMISLAFEDQRHFIGILALKSDGALDQGCEGDLLDRIVAQRLWIDHGVIRDVKKRLMKANLIDEEWNPVAWDKRQCRSDKDGTAAERQRRYRENKPSNALRHALRNGSVTRLDKEEDIDKEEDKTYSPEPGLPGIDDPQPNFTKPARPPCPHQEIIDLYHKALPTGTQVRVWNEKRMKTLQARWREDPERQTLQWWEDFFKWVAESEFLTGQTQSSNGRPPFVVSLDWLTNPQNFAKTIEGNYHRGTQ